MKLLVVGGVNSRNPKSDSAWAAYSGGKVLSLDLETGEYHSVFSDDSVPECVGQAEVGTVFKAAHLDADYIYLCTTTEVIKVSRSDWQEASRVSNPKFNDVHHVRPSDDGTLLVVSTGLDCLMQIDRDGGLVNSWPLSDEKAPMLSDSTDYRAVESTKPHAVHPNYVFKVQDNIYVTEFKTAKAKCINNNSAPELTVTTGNIHDGVVRDGRVWFTSTNGWLAAVDIVSGKQVEAYDLNEISSRGGPLGWCRGLAFVSDDVVAVGFSRLRPTKFKENIKWAAAKISKKFSSTSPTRVSLFDIKEKKLLREFDLEGRDELNAVFSLHTVQS